MIAHKSLPRGSSKRDFFGAFPNVQEKENEKSEKKIEENESK
jgi:hypothetical protein